jgi:glutaredoxin
MKVVVVYTMDGCPHCQHIKEELKKINIPFIERDIDEYENEYDEFSKVVGNDYVPALMLLTLDENEQPRNVKMLAPEKDYEDILEGVELIKTYLLD